MSGFSPPVIRIGYQMTFLSNNGKEVPERERVCEVVLHAVDVTPVRSSNFLWWLKRFRDWTVSATPGCRLVWSRGTLVSHLSHSAFLLRTKGHSDEFRTGFAC